MADGSSGLPLDDSIRDLSEILKFSLDLIWELRNETWKDIEGIVWTSWINMEQTENVFQGEVARQGSRAICFWGKSNFNLLCLESCSEHYATEWFSILTPPQ